MARKKRKITREDWKIIRPFLVDIVLLITDYIFNKDEEIENDGQIKRDN